MHVLCPHAHPSPHARPSLPRLPHQEANLRLVVRLAQELVDGPKQVVRLVGPHIHHLWVAALWQQAVCTEPHAAGLQGGRRGKGATERSSRNCMPDAAVKLPQCHSRLNKSSSSAAMQPFP